MIFTAESVEQLAEQFAQLPGIGRKTAHRLALFVVKMSKDDVIFWQDAMLLGVILWKSIWINCDNLLN